MVELQLNEETANLIASKYALEDVSETKTAEEIAAEEQAAADAQAAAEAAEAAKAKEKVENDGGSETDDDETDDDAPTPITHLIKQYGYKLEDFADIDVKDDSVEGIKKFYDKREALLAESIKKQTLSEDPDVEDLIAHKQQGLSIESWKAKKAAEELKIEFEATDIEGKADFLTRVYVAKGIPEKRAKLLVEALKDDNELDDEVTKEATAIKTARVEQANARIEAEKAAVKAEQDENEKVVAQVNTIIKQGTLDSIIIPETDRKAFNEFVLSEKLTEKHEKLSLEQRLFIDYLVFKDFKVKGIDKKATPSGGNSAPRVRMAATAGNNDTGEKEWKSLDELKNAINKRTQ